MSKIVFLGDSITLGVGYGGVTTESRFSTLIGLAAGYARADIINSGVGGDNSAGMLARIQSDVVAHAPGVCAVMAGNNDCYGVSPKFQTAQQYRDNMSAIVSALKSAGIRVVIISPMFVVGGAAEANKVHPYLKALEDLVAEAGVGYVDIMREYHYAIDRGEWSAIAHADNVHPSIAGHAFIAEYAMRPKHAAFFAASTVADPEPQPDPAPVESTHALTLAMADLLLVTAHPDLTGAIQAERAKFAATDGGANV